MPMNPRLLRPLASGVHPEAAAWRSAVVANGGSVSAATMRAVSKFCGDIDKNNLRSRFIRLNLFCGNDLLACLVPLYRGQSRTGTQFGNTTDTNSGSDLFVTGDYTETGAAGGLAGNAALTKHLMTGVPHNAMPQNDAHLACYETVRAGGTFRISIGSRESSASGGTNQFMLATWSSTANYSFLPHASSTRLDLANSSGGFYVGNITGATAAAIYRNGGSKATSSATTRTPSAETISVFGLNTAGTVASRTDARLAGYSMGLALASDADVLAYSNIMQDFQLALSRRIT
jgi:hypothetical protein